MKDRHAVRLGTVADSETISALAIQVFLDTYATAGVRADLARETFVEYGHDAFIRRLHETGRVFFLAERAGGLLGFAEVLRPFKASPVAGIGGAELVRLYVQPRAQGSGIGRALIERVEACAEASRCAALWLSAWEQNARALDFYQHMDYLDAGLAQHVIQGQSFANRILYKRTRFGAA